MLLCELFEDTGEGGTMLDGLRQQIMDYLTPLVSHDVDFVTIQDVEQTLRSYRTGLTVDRGLVMQLLDPNKIKLISKIEGDKIYLSTNAAPISAMSDDKQEQAQDKLSALAQNQAKKEITQ